VPDPDTLDPGLKGMLDAVNSVEGPPIADVTPAELRANYLVLAAMDGDVEEVASVEDRDIAGVPCRVYRPMGAADGDELAVLAWYHGGGWVIGDLESSDRTVRRLANRSGCVVVSVDYRRAPEQPFPAAVDDCWAVASWLAANAVSEGSSSRSPSRLRTSVRSASRMGRAVVGTRCLYPRAARPQRRIAAAG